MEYSTDWDEIFIASTCPYCGKPLDEVAIADSLLFPQFQIRLYRCQNYQCNRFGWIQLNKECDPEHPAFSVIFNNRSALRPLEYTKLTQQLYHALPLKRTPMPIGVESDFHKAYDCFRSNQYEASAVMARRALENALLGRGASPNSDLRDMIFQLSTQGILPPETEYLCNEIKQTGNAGAHSGSEISVEVAGFTLTFADIVITWLYSEVKPRKNKRSN